MTVNIKGNSCKESFVLHDEITQCIEALTVNLTSNSQFKYIHDDRLPDTVEADIDKFMLGLTTVAEFAMRFTMSGITLLRTNHEGVDIKDRNITKVGFHLYLNLRIGSECKIEAEK